MANMQSSSEQDLAADATGTQCPALETPPRSAVAPRARELQPDELLVFPKHKRALIQHVCSADGRPELHIHYRELVIELDEPELFPFADALVRTERFEARAATTWGPGYTWDRIRELLTQLLEAGLLQRARHFTQPSNGPVAVPLPAAPHERIRSWRDCEQLSRELTGHVVEVGHLELIMPVHRVVHAALDRDGRQVGEANVFPAALRVDVPTTWRTCMYPGSRYQDECPMNFSALQSLIASWKPLLAALLRVRGAYLERYPAARARLSPLDAHLLACVCMGISGYQMLRNDPVEDGDLHPILASLVRVGDGVRMTCTSLLAEQPSTGSSPLTALQLYAHAEQRNLMLSTYGVCAGSPKLIQTYLTAFFTGDLPYDDLPDNLDPSVEQALTELDPALQYTLLGTQLYALTSLAWGLASQTCEELAHTLPSTAHSPFAQRVRADLEAFRAAELGDEVARVHHRAVYGAMWTHAGQGLVASGATTANLPPVERAAQPQTCPFELSNAVASVLEPACRGELDETALTKVAVLIARHLQQEQALVRRAEAVQAAINELLGRTPPTQQLSADLLYLHHRMRHPAARLPYVVDTLRETTALDPRVTAARISLGG